MTVSELYDHVSRLGFEDSLEDDKKFYNAANRALLQVGAIRPATGIYDVNHTPIQNILNDSAEPILRSETLCFEGIGAKAFYFEADGEGAYYIDAMDGGVWKEGAMGGADLSSAVGRFRPYYGVIKLDGQFHSGAVRIRFEGDFTYTVRNVALYKDVYSNSDDDVPAFSDFVPYDMRALVHDFVSFASPPVQCNEGRVQLHNGYEIEGDSVILLPRESSGTYRVKYNRRRTAIEYKVNPSEDTTVLDLDEELCSALPLLVASYVWLEDEEQKASYYMNLYRERVIEIQRKSKNVSPVVIRDRYGWL